MDKLNGLRGLRGADSDTKISAERLRSMDAISPTFRLSSENDFREIFLFRDWRVNECAGLVYYQPLRLIFAIQCKQMGSGPVTPLWLSATLRHACPGYDIPPLPELSQLGKDAIHAFAWVSDLLTKWRQQNAELPPIDFDEDDEDVLRLNRAPLTEFVVTPDPDDDDTSLPVRPAFSQSLPLEGENGMPF